MAYYDDLSGAEACVMLGVSSGTFKARLFHARQKLLDGTERALVTPIRRTPASSSEAWRRKGLPRLQGLESSSPSKRVTISSRVRELPTSRALAPNTSKISFIAIFFERWVSMVWRKR